MMDEYVKAAVNVAAGSVPAREKGSMTDWTPNEEQAKRAYVTGMRQAFIASAGEHSEEWDRFIAAHDRVVAANAWDEGYRQGWNDRHEDWQAGYVPSGFQQDTPNPY